MKTNKLCSSIWESLCIASGGKFISSRCHWLLREIPSHRLRQAPSFFFLCFNFKYQWTLQLNYYYKLSAPPSCRGSHLVYICVWKICKRRRTGCASEGKVHLLQEIIRSTLSAREPPRHTNVNDEEQQN